MRYLFLASLLTISLSSFGWTEIKRGNSLLTLQGGIGASGAQYDLHGPEEHPITATGGAWGAQYLYFIRDSPAIALGVDGIRSANATYRADDLIDGFDSAHRLKSTVFLAVAKLAFPRGTFRPYVFGGVGMYDGSLQLAARPRSGRTWSDGGSDTRILVDQDQAGPAIGYGIGMDLFATEQFFLGFELRNTWLGGLDRERTGAAVASGIGIFEKGSVSQGNILVRLGWRLGS